MRLRHCSESRDWADDTWRLQIVVQLESLVTAAAGSNSEYTDEQLLCRLSLLCSRSETRQVFHSLHDSFIIHNFRMLHITWEAQSEPSDVCQFSINFWHRIVQCLFSMLSRGIYPYTGHVQLAHSEKREGRKINRCIFSLHFLRSFHSQTVSENCAKM